MVTVYFSLAQFELYKKGTKAKAVSDPNHTYTSLDDDFYGIQVMIQPEEILDIEERRSRSYFLYTIKKEKKADKN